VPQIQASAQVVQLLLSEIDLDVAAPGRSRGEDEAPLRSVTASMRREQSSCKTTTLTSPGGTPSSWERLPAPVVASMSVPETDARAPFSLDVHRSVRSCEER